MTVMIKAKGKEGGKQKNIDSKGEGEDLVDDDKDEDMDKDARGKKEGGK